jgi:hypothetical protein
MQMDSWFDVIVQEMIEANTEAKQLLEDAEPLLESDTIEEQAA